ncbi:MAG: CHAT domain-containing protein [Nitrosomonas sp.]|uniref:CHAT domain-containing protein n=1 Tax=Nitrosomonas sp. TaxID=42353 RepID=UPI001D470F63|nr:CHAT domain-containing protein [Nitrosomonas sp.]MBX9895460.1 CHAT domain-containing protein [Nitrosomonas sp.]
MIDKYNNIIEVDESSLPGILGNIVYIIPVEDGEPNKASFMQGFARSLIKNVSLIGLINTLPSDIWELSPSGQEIRLPRRMSGQAPVSWFGQSPRALTSMVTPVFAPFVVVFLGQNHNIETYQSWINAHPFPLTVVAETGGTIAYKDFSLDRLREAFLNICSTLEGQVHADSLAAVRQHIASWVKPKERELGYKVGAHNSIHPNILALHAAGFRDSMYGSFERINDGIGPYVEQIVRTTRSILDERKSVGEREANRYFRRPPSINLFAPAIYPHIREISLAEVPFSAEERKGFKVALRALEHQEGYAFEVKNEAQVKVLFGPNLNDKPQPHYLIQERAAELKLATECMGTLAASEISAVIRLPNAVNRTTGQVRHFAQQYHARHTSERKRAEVFQRVQNAITTSVPQEFLDFVEGADEGIRLISDAHLEWMNIRGLPLCIQKDVSRISVTPGNLFLEQVSSKTYRHITQADFSEILILSALQEIDPISKFFDIAIQVFAPHFSNRVRVRTVRVRNESDFIEALNTFEGAMMIFDGHGRHEQGQSAKLQLLDEEINIWQLQSREIRVPPIVVLSACDTHAADRNHASTANGFLSIGARTVLGSVFPIDAMDAATFIARLLYRVAEFVPSAQKQFSRSLTWMEIMGGMLRMQLLTDYCRQLEQRAIIDHTTYKEIHLKGNLAINSGKKWPFEVVISSLAKRGLKEELAWRELRVATANSTAISYLQLGRPETVIVHPDEGFPEKAKL